METKQQIKPLERWMWVFLESGKRPEWAHQAIDNQDLRDLIAAAIKDTIEATRGPQPKRIWRKNY